MAGCQVTLWSCDATTAVGVTSPCNLGVCAHVVSGVRPTPPPVIVSILRIQF